jgi:drug/metabolite transporter (DMT)-like permease
MPIHEIAALAGAVLWAVTGILATVPVNHLGAYTFSRYRMTAVLVMLTLYLTVAGKWNWLGPEQVAPVLLSGLAGIFIGDVVLFATLARLGPRRTSILFAMHAPISILLGWLFLGETLTPLALSGAATAFAGVLLAIVFGKRRSQLHQWESIKGPLWQGVALGLVAALGQATGSILARPVMETGIDPCLVSFYRVGVSIIAFNLFRFAPLDMVVPKGPLTPRIALYTGLVGFIGMLLGMTLILYALAGGKVGIVSTLAATSPALQLPLIWMRTKEVPAPGAWVGAILVVIGSALIFMR